MMAKLEELREIQEAQQKEVKLIKERLHEAEWILYSTEIEIKILESGEDELG